MNQFNRQIRHLFQVTLKAAPPQPEVQAPWGFSTRVFAEWQNQKQTEENRGLGMIPGKALWITTGIMILSLLLNNSVWEKELTPGINATESRIQWMLPK
jgi:hypothetical protein